MGLRNAQQSKTSVRKKSTITTRVQERTRKYKRMRKYYGEEKTRRGRLILAINLLRLCGAPIPAFNATVKEPPADLGYDVGLRIGDDKVSLLADIDRPTSFPKYHVGQLNAMQKQDPDQFVSVYTDGSFYIRENLCGYAVHWPKVPQLDAMGPVPSLGTFSSSKAEEYAIFLALLEILTAVLTVGNADDMYCVYSDCKWALEDIARWLRRWQNPKSLVAWKTKPAASTEHREILRVAAGLLWELRRLGVCVILNYVKAHVGEPGNETADIMAKFGSKKQAFFGPVPCFAKTRNGRPRKQDKAP